MCNKSETQKILLGLADPTEEVTHPYTKKLGADVVFIDGFIFLYSKGSDLCSLRILKQHPKDAVQISGDSYESSYAALKRHMELADTCEAESSSSHHPQEMEKGHHYMRRETGIWNDLGLYFEKLLKEAASIRDAKCIVLGFDKRQYISKAKSIAQRRRNEERRKTREKQIRDDTARGIDPTQGIPFTLDSIQPSHPLPYPWSEIASNKNLLGIVVQYLLIYHILPKFEKIRHSEDQIIVIDGHNLENIQNPRIPLGISNSIPLLIRSNQVIQWDPMRNTVGEFDHTIFHYMHHFTSSPKTRDKFRTFRILSNDTDILLLSICMLERPDLADAKRIPKIDLQIPTRQLNGPKYNLVRVNRLVTHLSQSYPIFWEIPRPIQNLAFILYLKAHDYDDPNDYSSVFLNQMGHRKLLQSFMGYHEQIGSIIQWNADGRFLCIRGESISKIIHGAYFEHYDKVKKQRIWEDGASIGSIGFDTLATMVEEANLGKSDRYKIAIPSRSDIVKKSLRLHFLVALFDDAIHGCANTETRRIKEENLDLFGFQFE
jgi:hypothetical protein